MRISLLLPSSMRGWIAFVILIALVLWFPDGNIYIFFSWCTSNVTSSSLLLQEDTFLLVTHAIFLSFGSFFFFLHTYIFFYIYSQQTDKVKWTYMAVLLSQPIGTVVVLLVCLLSAPDDTCCRTAVFRGVTLPLSLQRKLNLLNHPQDKKPKKKKASSYPFFFAWRILSQKMRFSPVDVWLREDWFFFVCLLGLFFLNLHFYTECDV